MSYLALLLLCTVARAEYFVVHFEGPITVPLLRRLSAVTGVKSEDYLGDNSVLVWLNDATEADIILATVPTVASVTPRTAAAARYSLATNKFVFPMRAERFSVHRLGNKSILSDAFTHSRIAVDALEHDADTGEPVVSVRVDGARLIKDIVYDTASHRCRTPITVDSSAIESGKLVLRNVHCDDAERVVDALSLLGDVKLAEIRVPFVALNRWSAPRIWRLKGGDQKTDVAPLNLTGVNQLLSMSDTGVQTETCFFADKMRVPRTTSQTVPFDTGHRTVRAYWSADGDFDDAAPFGGHGTHVAGTALGAAAPGTEARAFSGVAPGARLVFTDLQPANAAGEFLFVPDPLDSTIMQWSFDCGAKVHSASWGAELSGRYTSDEAALDRFAYFHREFLPIFAAGNGGPAPASIVSPSFAKNVLSIGATMNGVDAVRLAQTPSRPSDDYSPDWLAPFSARGTRTLSFRKPDLVAPGGAFIWSASNEAPQTGSCLPIESAVVGLQGTSMATPGVAGAAILLRQYFVDGRYNATAVNTQPPMASLIRAALVASAVPLRGVYPRTPFTSTQQRIDGQGHGRIALDRLFANNALTVLSNENAELALMRSKNRRWCIDVVGGAAYESITVALAYADYPSFPVRDGSASLVNDLRLRVFGETGSDLSVNELAAGTPEVRSTMERVVVTNQRRFTVDVSVSQLGFGDVQSYSLVLVLARTVGIDATLRISESFATQTQCVVCASAGGAFIDKAQCAVCGNGILEVGEECDGSTCCNPSTCTLLNDGSPCSVLAGECRLQGTCVGDIANPCAIDDQSAYVLAPLDSGPCAPAQPTLPPTAAPTAPPTTRKPTPSPTRPVPTRPGQPPTPTTSTTITTTTTTTVVPTTNVPTQAPTPAPCTAVDADVWRQRLIDDRSLFAPQSESQLCCTPLWAAVEQVEFEPLFLSLTREYAAALLNAARPGVVSSADQLLAIEAARLALESVCGLGFVDLELRSDATALRNQMRAMNTRCSALVNGVVQESCLKHNLDQRLCLGGGVFDEKTDTCVCNNDRQTKEYNCAHLACSGNGASVFNYESEREDCVCMPGWTGASCAQCDVLSTADVCYHCIGAPLSLIQHGSPHYFWTTVLTQSVADRLTGAYYSSPQEKVADLVPGTQQVDCLCRTITEQINWRAEASHFDVLQKNVAQRETAAKWLARAGPMLLPSTAKAVPIQTPVPSSTSLRIRAGGSSVWLGAVIAKVMLW